MIQSLQTRDEFGHQCAVADQEFLFHFALPVFIFLVISVNDGNLTAPVWASDVFHVPHWRCQSHWQIAQWGFANTPRVPLAPFDPSRWDESEAPGFSLVIMMPSLQCQQFMGCRCSLSWDNAGRKSTWVTQMPHGEELNPLDEVQNIVNTRSCGTKERRWKTRVQRESVRLSVFLLSLMSTCSILNLTDHHVWTSSWARHRHAYTTPNALGVAGWMFQLKLTPHCPTCFVQSQARHFPPSKSSSRIPAHELEAQMVLEIIGWENSRHRRHTVQLESYRPSSEGRNEGSTTQKERRNATPPKGGGNQAAPPNRREGERCLTQRRRRKATPPNGRRKNSNMTEKRRRRPSNTTQQKTRWKAAPTQRRRRKTTPPKGKGKTATPPKRKEETKQHHPTEDGGKSSPTRRRRWKATPPKRKEETKQHHPTEERRQAPLPKAGERRQHKQKKSKQQHHPKKEHEQIWEYLSLSVLVRSRDCAVESTRISVSRQRFKCACHGKAERTTLPSYWSHGTNARSWTMITKGLKATRQLCGNTKPLKDCNWNKNGLKTQKSTPMNVPTR